MILVTQQEGSQQPQAPPRVQLQPQPQPYKQYPQYPPDAQTQSQKPPPPMAPRRTIWPMVIAIVVVIIVVLAVVLIFLLQPRTFTMNFKEFLMEYDKDDDGDLDSPLIPETLKDGDIVNIVDRVAELETYEDSGTHTILWMESTENTQFKYYALELYGDKSEVYPVGDIISISLHLKEYVVGGETVILPEEGSIGGLTNGAIEPQINLAHGVPTGVSGEWEIEVYGVSSGEALWKYNVVLIKNASVEVPSTSLDDMPSICTPSSGKVGISFVDVMGEGELTAGDWFVVCGTDTVSDYQVQVFWKASSNKVSGNTGMIVQ